MRKSLRKQDSWRGWLARWMVGLLLLWLLISLLPVLLLRWLPPPTSAFMLTHWLAEEHQSAEWVGHPQQQWTDWQNIAPSMRLAVVAAEDQKFPFHNGFDIASIQDAVREHLRGADLRGASTISQQVAKNLFLWPTQSWLRKGLEAWFTLLIELVWSKQRILEVYLNIAEFGHGIYGVEAASREFFGITAAMLSPEQAALLATVLPNPKRYNANQPNSHMLERRQWVLKQMRQLGGPSYVSDMTN